MGVSLSVIRERGINSWFLSYLRDSIRRRSPSRGEPVHLLLCLADHFEPKLGKAKPEVAQKRVDNWVREYPKLFAGLRDSDGRPPRHTFFFPQEEYEQNHVEGLTELCRAGFGEVEIHLHHDADTAEGLRDKLEDFKIVLAERHGQLSRHRTTGQLAYGFIHGNWALDNSRPDGRWCGVNNELDVLRETGCYADFTLPSAPSPTQTRTINRIYYAVDDPCKPKSHDLGIDAGMGTVAENALLLIQGPLLLNWRKRKWGLLPRLENGSLQANQPPSMERLDLWLKARVQMPSRPDWFFVKLHTHGAKEMNQSVLLGPAMVRFHEDLARRAQENPHFRYHYVTAREMYNLAKAAEAGWTESVAPALDYDLVWNGSRANRAKQPIPATLGSF